MIFGGIPIHVHNRCLKDTDTRLFPPSRHRSRRIRKKLIRRHGGEFKQVPAIFQTARGFVCHPALYHQLKEALR